MQRDAVREQAQRIDERDTMFARMARRPGTPQYEEYYSRRADLKSIDARLAGMIPLLEPGSLYYDAEVCAGAHRYFSDIERIEVDSNAVRRLRAAVLTAPSFTAGVKRMVLDLGAVAAGCTALDQSFVYTNKGRFDEDYGRAVTLDHPSAIVFLVEMDFQAMQKAPRAEALRESARQYYRAAVVALAAASALEACGYRAKAHFDAHYDIILPPLAVRAGLGELGRNNILIADRYGSRVRIGAVTTDAPMERDRPSPIGAAAFCQICLKCAESCPAQALSLRGREFVRGVEKWPTNVERCYGYWRKAGTDCGICMTVCPFSHRNTRLHNAVRCIVRWTSRFNRALLFLDDLLYGREWKSSAARPESTIGRG